MIKVFSNLLVIFLVGGFFFALGAPLEVMVKDPAIGQEVVAIGLGLYQARANASTSFTVYTVGYSHNDFDVIITGPQENAVPVRCYQQKDGNLLTEFVPTATGIFAFISCNCII